ncbi:helix-turn-helix domain-containing protein [Micromonospora sp. DT48]|uniref:helix-turn-helix domain-containing protein n=1 Tax=Micromonospora sp. DT48 TaxID=3393429 RepID=UPI003CF91A48
MSSPQEVREARLANGRKLEALCRAAGYTQNGLALLTLYGRSTVANIELDRESMGRGFWVRCGHILGTGGALFADHDRMQAHARQVDRLSALRGLPQPLNRTTSTVKTSTGDRLFGTRRQAPYRHPAQVLGRLLCW